MADGILAERFTLRAIPKLSRFQAQLFSDRAAHATIACVADMTPWLPARTEWTDATGTAWTRARPHRPAEQDARRLVRQFSTRVAIERILGSPDIEWLDPAARKD